MDSALLSIAYIGLLVGLRHAFEPDHLAAVATLALGDRGFWRVARLGLAWGIGHSVSIAAVAILVIALGVQLPAGVFALAEGAVATLLIALGLSTLYREATSHRRSLGPPHTFAHEARHPHLHPHHIRSTARALGFGLAHGLAGGGAVIALLLAAAGGAWHQAWYLAAFGAGTIAGMSAVTIIAGTATRGALGGTASRALAFARLGTGALSTAVGVTIALRLLD